MGWVYAIEVVVTVLLLVLIFRHRREHPGVMLTVMYVICVLTSLGSAYMVWGAQYGNDGETWLHNVPWALVNAITIFMGGGDFDFAQTVAGNPSVGMMSVAYECSRLCALFTFGTVIVSLFTGNMMDRIRVMFRIGRYCSVVRVHFPEGTDASQVNDFVKTLGDGRDDSTLVSINRPNYYKDEDLGRRVRNLVFQESIADRAARKAQEVVDIRFSVNGVSVRTRLQGDRRSAWERAKAWCRKIGTMVVNGIKTTFNGIRRKKLSTVRCHDEDRRNPATQPETSPTVWPDVMMMDYDDVIARDYINRVFIPQEQRRIKGYPKEMIENPQTIVPMRMLIVGDLDGLGGQILRRVIMNAQRPSAAKSHTAFRLGSSSKHPSDGYPEITICTPRRDEMLGAYQGRYPMLDEFADIRYLDYGSGSEDLYALLKRSEEDGVPFEYVVVAGADSDRNSPIARDIRFYLAGLRSTLVLAQPHEPPIIAAYVEYEPQTEAIEDVESQTSQIQTDDISYFGSRSRLYALNGLRNGEMDRMARLINAFYCENDWKPKDEDGWRKLVENVEKEECEDWRTTSQFNRNSSRASAEFVGVEEAWLQKFCEIDIPGEAPEKKEKRVSLLIRRLEHMRWCAFYAAMGFTHMSDATCKRRCKQARDGKAYWRDALGKPKQVDKWSAKDCLKFARADTPDCLDSAYQHVCLTPWDKLKDEDELCNDLKNELKRDHLPIDDLPDFNFQEEDGIVLDLLKFYEELDKQEKEQSRKGKKHA